MVALAACGSSGDDTSSDTTSTTRTAVSSTSAPSTTAAPTTPPTTAVSYADCDAVRAAGKAPLHAGQPGYSTDLDRDGDGVACEN
ncbi:MAG TPA: excalibur calcium-binding domain-containing protein [Jatrophihabitantaceae bacterium]|jgi:hypothetical protein